MSDGEIEHGSTEYWRREAEESDSHEWCEDCESSYFAHFDSCPHCERRVATDGGRDQSGDEIDHVMIGEVIDEVEETVVEEDMLGASREQVVRGTLQRVRRRLNEVSNDD